MPITKQTQAIDLANQVGNFLSQLIAVKQTADRITGHYVSDGAGAVLAALPTVAQNADGSLRVADANPVIGNPIDPTKTNGLNRAVSSYRSEEHTSELQSPV